MSQENSWTLVKSKKQTRFEKDRYRHQTNHAAVQRRGQHKKKIQKWQSIPTLIIHDKSKLLKILQSLGVVLWQVISYLSFTDVISILIVSGYKETRDQITCDSKFNKLAVGSLSSWKLWFTALVEELPLIEEPKEGITVGSPNIKKHCARYHSYHDSFHLIDGTGQRLAQYHRMLDFLDFKSNFYYYCVDTDRLFVRLYFFFQDIRIMQLWVKFFFFGDTSQIKIIAEEIYSVKCHKDKSQVDEIKQLTVLLLSLFRYIDQITDDPKKTVYDDTGDWAIHLLGNTIDIKSFTIFDYIVEYFSNKGQIYSRVNVWKEMFQILSRVANDNQVYFDLYFEPLVNAYKRPLSTLRNHSLTYYLIFCNDISKISLENLDKRVGMFLKYQDFIDPYVRMDLNNTYVKESLLFQQIYGPYLRTCSYCKESLINGKLSRDYAIQAGVRGCAKWRQCSHPSHKKRIGKEGKNKYKLPIFCSGPCYNNHLEIHLVKIRCVQLEYPPKTGM